MDFACRIPGCDGGYRVIGDRAEKSMRVASTFGSETPVAFSRPATLINWRVVAAGDPNFKTVPRLGATANNPFEKKNRWNLICSPCQNIIIFWCIINEKRKGLQTLRYRIILLVDASRLGVLFVYESTDSYELFAVL